MIIIFGGSFNPPHIAHRIIAEFAYDEFQPENFFVIPAFSPPHKKEEFIENFDIRFSWCKKVFYENYFNVSDLEARLPVPSYTINTVEYLSRTYNNINLLIGEDSLKNFKKWHRWNDIVKKVELIVYPRYCDNSGFKNSNLNFKKLESPILEISSSYIRERVKNQKTIKGLVDDKILEEVIRSYT